jgi:2-oxo-4-hydroxy-4-carboxy--5-ureidoimidazoline (OHCU) decarboxylase
MNMNENLVNDSRIDGILQPPSYQVTTPESDETVTTTTNVANAVPNTEFVITDDERAQLQLMRANPDVAAKVAKVQERAEAEGASAVRGNVVNAIESAVSAAVAAMIDTDGEGFIDGSESYLKRVGKVTTTCEVHADGKQVVSTKSPRRKQSTTTVSES